MAARAISGLVRLSRLGMAPLTMSVPVTAAWIAGGDPSAVQIASLMLLGLSAHIFGFTLNDLIDYPLDRHVRPQHPLATGELRWPLAWAYTLGQIPLSILLYGLVLNGPRDGLVMLIFSMTLSVIYNRYSKWGAVPRILAELALAASVALLGVAGGIAFAPMGGLLLAHASMLFGILLLVNSVPSGLKDLHTDALHGARSFVLAAGARMVDTHRYTLPRLLMSYSYILQFIVTGGLLTLILTQQPNLFAGLLAVVCSIYALLHLRMLLAVRWINALRRSYPLLGGYFNYAALLLLVGGPLWFRWLATGAALVVLSVPLQTALRRPGV